MLLSIPTPTPYLMSCTSRPLSVSTKSLAAAAAGGWAAGARQTAAADAAAAASPASVCRRPGRPASASGAGVMLPRTQNRWQRWPWLPLPARLGADHTVAQFADINVAMSILAQIHTAQCATPCKFCGTTRRCQAGTAHCKLAAGRRGDPPRVTGHEGTTASQHQFHCYRRHYFSTVTTRLTSTATTNTTGGSPSEAQPCFRAGVGDEVGCLMILSRTGGQLSWHPSSYIDAK